MNMNEEALSKIIKKIRKDNQLTQQQLANRVGVTYQAVSKWENKRNIPDLSTLRRVSDEFDINIEELLTGSSAVRNSQRYRLVLIVVSLLLVGFVLLSIKLATAIDSYALVKVQSANPDFAIEGVAVFGESRSSLQISHIETSLNDTTSYESLESTIYELDGHKHTQISRCDDIVTSNTCSGTPLAELLGNITFSISDLSLGCEAVEQGGLYLQIDAFDSDKKNISYKVPLKIDSGC